MALPTVGGVARRKIVHASELANDAGLQHVAGGKTSALSAVIGKTSKTLGAYSLAPVSTNILDTIFWDLYDVDLTQTMYFDIIYSVLGTPTGDEGLTVTATRQQIDFGSATANNVDTDTLVALSGTAATGVWPATDFGSARVLTGLYIAGSVITDNEDALAIRSTLTIAGTVAAGDVCIHAFRLRYTSRAGY
jgi:hypothetical protein